MKLRLSADFKIGQLSWIIQVGPLWIQGSLNVEEGDRSDNVRIMPCEKLTIAGFEDERGAWAKEWGQLQEAGKGKNINSPLETPGRNAALLKAWVLPKETYFGLLIFRTVKRINLYC